MKTTHFLLASFLLLAVSLNAQDRYWTGFTSTSWTVTGNWSATSGGGSASVPTSSNNVIIETTTGNYPSITSTTQTVNNITFSGNGVINLSPAGTLEVLGDFTNNTTPGVVLGSGTVTMNRQSSGSAATMTGDTEIPNLVVTGSSGSNQVNIGSNTTISIKYSVRVESGVLNTNDELVLLSPWDAVGGECEETAYVDVTGSGINGTINGNVTVQRCIFEDYKTYHYFSSPVHGTDNTVGDQIDDNFDNTQYSTDPGHYGTYAFDIPYPAAPDYFHYDETDSDPYNSCRTFPGYSFPDPRFGWTGITDGSYVLTPGTAICARFATTNHLLDFYGPLNDAGDDPIQVALSYTNNSETDNDGYNLIGNPYPSPIDADQLDGVADISNVISVWANNGDEYDGTYQAYNCSTEVSTGLWTDGFISIGQGFFVQALSDDVFNFTSSMRVADEDPIFWKNEESSPDRLGLTISAGGRKDETLIVIDKTASVTYDRKKDGGKLTNPRPAHNIYTLKDGAKLAINGQPLADFTTIVPVNIALSNLENTTLIVSQFQKENGEIEYYLEDRLLGTSVLLTEDYTYAFETNTDSVSDRFFIKIVNHEGNKTDLADDQKIGTYADRKNIHVLFSDLELNSAYITVTDMMGKIVIAENVPVNGGKAVMKLETAQTGVYVVNVKSATINSSKKIFINQVN